MGTKISNLPGIVAPALTDIFPIVQGGVTYKETMTQLSTLFATAGANINITSLGGLLTPLSIPQGGTGISTFGTGVATALGQNVNGTGAITLTSNPIFVAPNLGVGTATSLTFNPTTNGIIGTPTNNNASATFVGEVISSTVLSASAVALVTNTPANITSIPLTAGDWNVYGTVTVLASGANLTVAAGWTSIISATLPDSALYNVLTSSVFNSWGSNAPTLRVSAAGATTVYLSVSATFAAGTAAASGSIFARRER